MAKVLLSAFTLAGLQALITAQEATFYYAIPGSFTVAVDSNEGPVFSIVLDNSNQNFTSTTLASYSTTALAQAAVTAASTLAVCSSFMVTLPAVGDSFFVQSTLRRSNAIASSLVGTANLVFGTIAPLTETTASGTLVGVSLGYACYATPTVAKLPAGIVTQCVSALNGVTVGLYNTTAAPIVIGTISMILVAQA